MQIRQLAILSLLALPVLAQTSLSGWERVRQLPHGKEVSVEKADGDRITGKLAAVTDNTVVVTVGRRDQSIPRAEVRSVARRLDPRYRKLYTALGAGIGLAAGVAASVPLGFRQCGESCDGERAAMVGLVVGLPVGGAVLGRQLAGRGELAVVYAAP